MTSIVWFRNDLRTKDQSALSAAAQAGSVVPVYVLDPRLFGKTPAGFPKTGSFRARFLLESLSDLRQSLRNLGSDLLIARGLPEIVLPEIAAQFGAQTVVYNSEVCTEEVAVEAALQTALTKAGLAWAFYADKTLAHPEDLPFPLQSLPEVYTHFRKKVESYVLIREPMPAPTRVRSPKLPDSPLPSWVEMGLLPPPPDTRAVLPFLGGESQAWQRLEHYFWQEDRLKLYKETRNGLLGADYSSKFSPWLSMGCISPRSVYAEVKRYERERTRGDGSYWLVFELLWRDYFQFLAAKHGPSIFLRGGLRGWSNYPWKTNDGHFQAWTEGRTGYPIVDANMRELAATGFMSNRGRQIVASFFTKNLALDWRLGAQWFESLLLDYDPASNYGNWNFQAGIGNDPRGFRYYEPFRQGKKHDPEAEYIKTWLPELRGFPAAKLLKLWELPFEEIAAMGLHPNKTYPAPIVDFRTSLEDNREDYEAANPDLKKKLGNYKIKRVAEAQRNQRR